jgi:CRP/FNR family transcriptional regulator, cyclic AMP receptor protein
MAIQHLQGNGHAEFLSCVEEPFRGVLARRVRIIRLPKGRALLEKDSPSANVFLVRSGSARVVIYSSVGREVWVNTAEPGDLIGEIAALDGEPRSASVVALSELVVATISAADFLDCLTNSPAASLWISRRLAKVVRYLTEQVYELSTLNVQTRIQRELLRLARKGDTIDNRVEIRPAPTHAEMASRIGTHREAVTRELQALSQQRIISHGRRSFAILDVERLQRMADR